MMKKIFLISICSALMALLANAQSGSTRSTERHFWGAIADASSGDLTNINELKENYSKLLLSWRMLPTESYETAFDVYRQTASGWEKINPEPIVNSTNFQVPDEHVMMRWTTPTSFAMPAPRLPWIPIPSRPTSWQTNGLT